MHMRMLSKSSFLGFSLGALMLAATHPAHAEPAETRKQDSAIESDEPRTAPDGVTQQTTRTVSLAMDMDQVQKRVNAPLMLTSGALFATGYIPALVTTLANSKNTSGWLGVPVVGPWIDWGPNTSPGNKVLLFTSGLLQGAGLAGAVASFFVPESKTDKMPLMGKRRFHVAPVAGRGSYALSASGTF